MMIRLLVLVAVCGLPLISSLRCAHQSTVTNALYSNTGMLIRAYTSNYNMGVMECKGNLTLCVEFQSMDVSFFNTLDVAAEDDEIFVDLIKDNNGKVWGRSCMSEADSVKIKAIEEEECVGNLDFSCACETDECTGASGVRMTMIALLFVIVYYVSSS